jgi:signal transduction histidine kinase
MLDELGLIGAVEFYVEGINKRRMLQVNLEVASTPCRLADKVEIALFRVVQAALANVQLHSGSKCATIRIAQDREKLILEIIDRGHGFAPEALKRNDSMRKSGVGLLGIKERLELIGGRLEIETGNQGTVVRGVVPISSFSAHAS